MKKILIIQTASIGDVILATSAIETLHAAYPEAKIDFLVKKGMEGLFTGHPFLRNTLIWDKKSGKLKGFFSLLKQIRHSRYDLVINIQRFLLTGLLTAFSGASETRGFSKNPVSFLFSRKISHRIGKIHEIERNHDLLEGLVNTGPARPSLYPAAKDFSIVKEFQKHEYYTFSPASLWFTKQYPKEKWIELAAGIPAERNVFLLGSGSDFALCESILSGSGHPGMINLSGKLSFLQSAALMKSAKMNFTNDSAPMHLASSVDAPVTAIFCSTIPGFGFGPLSHDSAVVQIGEELPCRPCGLHGLSACPQSHFKCAIGIDTRLLEARL